MGSNQQPLDAKSNALPTALPRKICEVGFKQLLYSAIVSDKIIIFSLFVGCFYHKGLAVSQRTVTAHVPQMVYHESD